MKNLIKNAFSLDLRALAVLRILVGGTLVVDLLYRLVNLMSHYTDQGILPRASIYEWSPLAVSLHYISGNWEIQLLIFIVAIVFGLMMMLGYRTRFATVVSWLLLISLHNRNPFILQGGDEYMRMIIFWCMFLPWNRVYSLDSLSRPKPETYRYFSIACIPLIVQVMLLYIIPTYSRITSQWLSEGSATYYALSLDQVLRPIGAWLYPYPQLLKGLTHYVFWLERLGPLLFIIPWKNHIFRTTGVFLFVTLHIGLGVCLMIGLFPFIGAFVPLGLLPTSIFDKIENFCKSRFASLAEQIKMVMMGLKLYLSGKKTQTALSVKRSKFDRYYLNTILICSFILVLTYNYERVATIRFGTLDKIIPHQVRGMAYLFKLDQHWQMFSPYVPDVDGWYIMKGTLNDDSEVELLQPNSQIAREKPGDMLNYVIGDRWRKYLENFYRERELLSEPLAKYLRQQWDQTHTESEHLKRVDIIFVVEETLPNYQEAPTEPFTLATYFIENDSIAVY